MRYKSELVLVVGLVFAASMLFYVQCVLVPHQRTEAALHGIPRGNLSDLYPRWLGARELLLRHRDPYSLEVTRDIQIGYYGRPLEAGRSYDPKDQQSFAYPIYIVFLLSPTIAMQFEFVQVAFRWLLVILTVVAPLLWLRALSWRPRPLTTALFMALTLCSFPGLQGLKLQQLSLLVSAMIAGVVVLLAGSHLLLAGVLMALATIKPQLAALPAAWVLFWTISSWRGRQRFFWGFAGTMTVLVGGGQWLLPGWIGRFYQSTVAYRQYTGGSSLLSVLAGAEAGALLSGVAMLALVYVCWRMRLADADSPNFALVFALVLAITLLVIPMTAPYNQLLLLPAVLLVVRSRSVLTARSLAWRLLSVLAGVTCFWPWLAATGLMVAALFVPAVSLQQAWAIPLYTILMIPLGAAGMLLLLVSGALANR